MLDPGYDLREVPLTDVERLIKEQHGYGSVGGWATYCFAVFEQDKPVAAYVWQPPPHGSAKSVCPECPGGVLALSRMAAVPRAERTLNHVSKPLRRQMKVLMDRHRWPVLVTYSDEGQGHTGHVYKCSGWKKTSRKKRPYYVNSNGERSSIYKNGQLQKADGENLIFGGHTWLQRWEHWACSPGEVKQYMSAGGWSREPIPGKFWKSGNQAHTWIHTHTSEGAQTL